jgi:hypothetical protein
MTCTPDGKCPDCRCDDDELTAATWTDTIAGDPFWEVRPSVWAWVKQVINGVFR